MDNKKLLISTYLISSAIILIGSFIKILHVPGAHMLLIIGAIVALFFIITALREVWKSNKITSSEKILWSVALTFMYYLGGLLYLLNRRHKVVGVN